MPVYEYKALGKGCEYCQSKFEVKQSIKEEQLKKCPKCGAPVQKLFSFPSILTRQPISAVDSVRERIAGNIPPEKSE